jgi:hypothetical protein
LFTCLRTHGATERRPAPARTEDWRRPRRAPHLRQRPHGLAIAPAPELHIATMPTVRITVGAREASPLRPHRAPSCRRVRVRAPWGHAVLSIAAAP